MPRSMNDNCLIAHYGQHINDFRKILDIQLGRRKRSESSPPIPYPAPRYGAVQIQYRYSTDAVTGLFAITILTNTVESRNEARQ